MRSTVVTAAMETFKTIWFLANVVLCSPFFIKNEIMYYPLPNKRTGTIGTKLLRSGGGLAWVRSKKLSEILVGTFIRVGTILE